MGFKLTYKQWKSGEDTWLKIIEGIEKGMDYDTKGPSINGTRITGLVGFCAAASNSSSYQLSCRICPLGSDNEAICIKAVKAVRVYLNAGNYEDALKLTKRVLEVIRKYEPTTGEV